MYVERIRLLKQAKEDLKSGQTFYDKIEKGLGDYFYDSLISDIESLNIYAGVHEKQFTCFKMSSKRFPYFIYYEVATNVVTILAILDARQSPKMINERFS